VVPKRKRPTYSDPADEPLATPVAPSKLAALGYLPSNMNVVLGVQVRQLRQTDAGRKLLTEKIDTGTGNVVVARLVEGWTGLDLSELDHLVVAVRTDDVEVPQVVVVARSSRTIDRLQVISTLKAEERKSPRKGPLVYHFQSPNGVFRPTLWFADDRTMVFDLLSTVNDAPETPREGLDHLPFTVRDALREKLDSGSLLWLVGSVNNWKKTTDRPWFQAVQTFVGGLRKVDLARLTSLQVLAVGVQVDQAVKAQAAIRCQDEVAAKSLRAALVGPEGVAPPSGVKAELDSEWLLLQWTGSLDAVLKTAVK
jgi:hypothetical protein